jgi:TRAP-type C4-dicarboxylate transport system substrate-binding protein
MVRSLVTLTAMSVLVGCGGADKVSGVQPSGVKTLTLANGNENQGLLQAWLDEVRTLSNGRLRIRVRSDWRLGERDFESGLIADVRSGRAQLGWVGTRAWTGTGAHSFDALNAPFLVDSYATEEAMLRGADQEQLFAGVTAAGVEPVGLLPGPLHLLLARRPVERATDLQGLKIGLFASEVGERALRMLGASPVPLARGKSMSGLDAVAASVGDLAGRYIGEARYLVADAPFGAAPRLIFANRSTWANLSQDEREILRRAAEVAFAPMLRNIEAGDRAGMTQLCDGGVRLVDIGAPGPEQLRAELGPLYRELGRLADASAELQAAEHARASGETPRRLACKPASQSHERALTGTFEWRVRRGEPGAERVDFEGAAHVRYRLELSNGRAVQTVVFPDGHSEPGSDDKYEVYRDRITFGGDSGPPDTARWRLDGDKLRFSELSQDDPDGHFVWESHTWIRMDR